MMILLKSQIIKIIFSCLFLTACTTVKEIPVQIDKVPLNLEEPAPLKLSNYEIFLENKSICVTSNDYQKIANNMNDIKAYIVKLRRIIKTYKEYYEK